MHPTTCGTLILQLMALKDSASAPVVRPPWNDTVVIKRLLDGGFYNFLIPFVESEEEARHAVAATRYPPAGVRGVSVSHRSNRYGTVPDYLATVNDNICVIVQIESRSGVASIDAIARSTASTGSSSGRPISRRRSAISAMRPPRSAGGDPPRIRARRGAGKASGILAPIEADARRYLEWGATFVAVGSDLGLFRGATQALRDRFAGVTAAALASSNPGDSQ